MSVPPTILRGRIQTTTYLYEDTERPERVTGTVSAPLWTADDRSLFLGLALYESTLCGGCGEPQETAWHSYSEGEYLKKSFVCHGCTAQHGGEERVYHAIVARPPAAKVAKYPPFDINRYVTAPAKMPGGSDGD